jgi:hypothetical protein
MTEFTQGDRVQTTVGESGIVVSVKDGTPKVGFDNPGLGYGEMETDILMRIDHSPAIATLLDAYRAILLALHEKRSIEGQHEARQALRDYGYLTPEDALTPYGRYRVSEWVKAGMPVEAEVTPEPAILEAQESTPPTPEVEVPAKDDDDPVFKVGDKVQIRFTASMRERLPRLKKTPPGIVTHVNSHPHVKNPITVYWEDEDMINRYHPGELEHSDPATELQESISPVVEVPVVVLPPELGGAELELHAEMRTLKQQVEQLEAAKAELEIEVERLRNANALLSDSVRIKNAEIRLNYEEMDRLRKVTERQQQELEDVKTKRLSLKTVGSVERILSTIECEVNGEHGTLRQSFLPALEQPKTAPLEVSIPQMFLSELEAVIDSMEPEQKAAALHRMGATRTALNVLWEEFDIQWGDQKSA